MKKLSPNFPKPLNQKAAQVLDKLYESCLANSNHVKLEMRSMMPLSIEVIGRHPLGEVVSVMHYYVQCGDLMRDPEMTFIRYVVQVDGDTHGFWLPASFRNDGIGFNQESILEDTRYYKRMQREQKDFANQWMQNIKDQGWLTLLEQEVQS